MYADGTFETKKHYGEDDKSMSDETEEEENMSEGEPMKRNQWRWIH